MNQTILDVIIYIFDSWHWHVHFCLWRGAGKAITKLFYIKRFRFIVLNATFNNISVIWWRSGLLV